MKHGGPWYDEQVHEETWVAPHERQRAQEQAHVVSRVEGHTQGVVTRELIILVIEEGAPSRRDAPCLWTDDVTPS